jgi:hypothetical protein
LLAQILRCGWRGSDARLSEVRGFDKRRTLMKNATKVCRLSYPADFALIAAGIVAGRSLSATSRQFRAHESRRRP